MGMSSSGRNGTIINARSMVFSHLFYTGRFEVPWHQRRYDWKEENVLELLHDIDEAVREDRSCYFLGAVMLVEKQSDFWQINDGQQRMVTISLIVAYLCRLFRSKNDSRRETLALRILFQLDENSTDTLDRADELEPRLTPPRDDKTRFNLMIRGKDVGSNGKLTLAWRKIENFFLGMGPDKSNFFFDFLLNRIEIACLYIPNSVDPNSVYETTNSRGKRLEDLDLIRNYIYSYFNSEREKSRRDTVHDSLDESIQLSLNRSDRISEYARCYFQCQYGFLPKNRFYRETRNKISEKAAGRGENSKKPADYVYDLVEDFSRKQRVELFRVITSPSPGDPFIDRFIKDSKLKKMNSRRNLFVLLKELQSYTVVQPLVFALLCHYIGEQDSGHRREMAKIVHEDIKMLNSFVMRLGFVLSKFEPSHFESEFSALAQKITASRSVKDIDFRTFLEECDGPYGVLDNPRFLEKMKYQEIRNASKARRFLFGIDQYIQTDGQIINENRCTVEHILPKSEKHWGWWDGFRNEDPRLWVYRIGNLTLLGQQDNKPGNTENQSFARKRAGYKKSAIRITQEMADTEHWSPDTIDQRQHELVKTATRVWPV